jgi:hypothetical protein
VESWSYHIVFLEKILTLFRINKHVSGVAWPTFLISVFSARVNCKKL